MGVDHLGGVKLHQLRHQETVPEMSMGADGQGWALE